MKHALKKYKLYQRVLTILNEGIDKDILNDLQVDGFFADEYVWDTIADHMDSIWHQLTEEERNGLRNNGNH